MKEKTRATLFCLFLAVGFVYLCVKCNKQEYEEIHSPHIEEDGSVLKIKRK